MQTAPIETNPIELLLRDAFGMARDFVLSDEETEGLRRDFSSISPYLIVFTARSGSTFLTHELEKTGVLSLPNEWFNYDNVTDMMNYQKFTFSEYMRDTIRTNRSENGIFGSEINWLQLVALNAIVPVQRLFPKRIRWFFLRRRNLVAQGVSNFIAARSQIYHAYQLGDSGADVIKAVTYDGYEIREQLSEIFNQEVEIEKWLRLFHVNPVNIYYEDLVEDSKQAAMLFANVMNVWLPKEYLLQTDPNPMKKLGTSLNLEFEQRFRDEEGDFLSAALKRRPTVLSPSNSI